MTNQFQPPVPEKLITVNITAREAHLLKILRGINFGKITVQKIEGKLVRVEPVESVLLSEEAGLSLLTDARFPDSIEKTVVKKK